MSVYSHLQREAPRTPSLFPATTTSTSLLTMATAGEDTGEYGRSHRFSSFPFRSGGRDDRRVDEKRNSRPPHPGFSSIASSRQADTVYPMHVPYTGFFLQLLQLAPSSCPVPSCLCCVSRSAQSHTQRKGSWLPSMFWSLTDPDLSSRILLTCHLYSNRALWRRTSPLFPRLRPGPRAEAPRRP